MKLKLLVLLILYFSSLFWQGSGNKVAAQDKHLIDSLQNLLAKHNSLKLKHGQNAPAMFDTTAANILFELSKINWYNNPDKAIEQAEQSQKIAEQIDYKDGVGFALYSKGVSYVWKLDYQKALEFTEKSLTIGEAIGNKKLEASSLVNIGLIYLSYNSDAVAMKNFLSALKIAEEIGNDEILVWCYVNITNIYFRMGNYEAVLKTSKAALSIAEKINDKFLMANCYGNIGSAYSQLGQYSESLKNHTMSLKISEELDDKIGAATTLLSIGWLYQIQGNYPEALKNHFASLKLYEELENKEGIALVFGNIGHIYTKQKKYQEAKRCLDESLSISKELKMIDNIRYIYGEMVALDSAQGHFKSALEHYKFFIEARDSLVNENKIKEITQQQMQYEFDKRQLADSLSLAQEREIGAINLERQKAFTFGGLGGLVVAILLLFLVYTNYNKQLIANQKLNEAQQQLFKIEKEKEAEKIRANYARDLHDDLGATLSSISVYSIAAQQRLNSNNTQEVSTMLERISTDAQEMAAAVSERVWLMKTENNSVEKLIEHLQLFASPVLSARNILFKFECDEKLNEVMLTTEARKNIYLLFKEAINNSAKYSNAGFVILKASIVNQQLNIMLSDDGIGFDSSLEMQVNKNGGGNGLKNMQQRADAIDARLTVNSSTGKGTSINFFCALPKIEEQLD